MLAAIIGRDAFFEPDIVTSPSTFFPPLIMYSDIFLPPFTFIYIYYVVFAGKVNSKKSTSGNNTFLVPNIL